MAGRPTPIHRKPGIKEPTNPVIAFPGRLDPMTLKGHRTIKPRFLKVSRDTKQRTQKRRPGVKLCKRPHLSAPTSSVDMVVHTKFWAKNNQILQGCSYKAAIVASSMNYQIISRERRPSYKYNHDNRADAHETRIYYYKAPHTHMARTGPKSCCRNDQFVRIQHKRQARRHRKSSELRDGTTHRLSGPRFSPYPPTHKGQGANLLKAQTVRWATNPEQWSWRENRMATQA